MKVFCNDVISFFFWKVERHVSHGFFNLPDPSSDGLRTRWMNEDGLVLLVVESSLRSMMAFISSFFLSVILFLIKILISMMIWSKLKAKWNLCGMKSFISWEAIIRYQNFYIFKTTSFVSIIFKTYLAHLII